MSCIGGFDVINQKMKYGYLDDKCLEDYKPHGVELVQYYNDHIETVAELLGVNNNKVTRGIFILLEQGNGAGYSNLDKKITYRFQNKDDILHDKGRIIHEGAHVVQNYPDGITFGHPCWCWMEGLADYCRAYIDKEFNLEEGLKGNAMDLGYKDNAHLLTWLHDKFRDKNIIHRLQEIIYNETNNFMNSHDVLEQLINEPPIYVLRDYYEENKNKFITN